MEATVRRIKKSKENKKKINKNSKYFQSLLLSSCMPSYFNILLYEQFVHNVGSCLFGNIHLTDQIYLGCMHDIN